MWPSAMVQLSEPLTPPVMVVMPRASSISPASGSSSLTEDRSSLSPASVKREVRSTSAALPWDGLKVAVDWMESIETICLPSAEMAIGPIEAA